MKRPDKLKWVGVTRAPQSDEQQCGTKSAEQLMHDAGFTDVWYAHPGPGELNRFGNRWHVGVWTGPQHDLICVKKCGTNEEANRWLSPGADSIQEAVEKACVLRNKTDDGWDSEIWQDEGWDDLWKERDR